MIRDKDASTSEEIRQAALEALRLQSRDISDKCLGVVKTYLFERKRHEKLMSCSISASSSHLTEREQFHQLLSESATNGEEAAMAYLLQVIDKKKIYQLASSPNFSEPKDYQSPMENLFIGHGLWWIREVPVSIWQRPWAELGYSAHKGSVLAKARYQCMLLYWYLPKFVLTAMDVLVTLWTGWNTSTIASITNRHITVTPKHILIEGAKTKNGQAFSYTVVRRNEPWFYDVMLALQRHARNIEIYGVHKRQNRSLFATYANNGSLDYQLQYDIVLGSQICTPLELPLFTKKQLRDQAANELYLETLDPFKVKEKLGHTDISSTYSYLNQHVIRLMNDANINRFMDKLAATITWSVRGDSEVEACGMQTADIMPKLFFPIGGAPANMQSIVDDWLNAEGTLNLKIGVSEIEHLRFQIQFYRENKERLQSDNPKGFFSDSRYAH